ncbi:GIY-YIG nuclease family protein [Devosia submarina]|uniref:GIY-YIG nuclease family protein n=1 Tax=Devosia submarina TaxID=1173082 RepID=UPI000D354607|nr:GIY-YIG nuclease family protein [Devosia submarina]
MARPRLQNVERTPSGQISRSRKSYEQRGLLSHDGYVVYFAKADDGMKIGFSGATKSRMPSISRDKGRVVRVVGLAHLPSEALARKLERKLHETLSGKRIKGEWFELTMSDVLSALAMCRKIGIRTSGGQDASDDVRLLSGLAYGSDHAVA